MTEAVPLLSARGIAMRYGAVVALRSADLTVMPGEIHALLGANGAGKSTLVKILSGVFPPDAGTVQVDGSPVDLRRPTHAVGAGLATVFQDPTLIPDLTIYQNLRLTDLDESVVRDWLSRLDLGHLEFNVLIRDLPLPALRLLDLARALAQNPRLLMLDEITAALTTDQADRVFAVMEEWKQSGRSVLFISHRLGEVLAVCDRATILRNGRSVETLAPREGDEAGLVAAMLGETAEAVSGEIAARSVSAGDRPVVLAGRDLQRGGRVNGVSFELHAGEILGLAALEGQGQDQLFQLLSGDRRPDGGEVLVNGSRLDARSPYDAIRTGVVLVPADRLMALLPQRSVRENLTIPLYNRLTRWFGLVRDETTRVDNAVNRLDIDLRAGKQAQRLSGGNQQKVTIGRWLASGFKTLLCFDPTRGIDIQTKAQIYDLLRELADEGAAILLYTSELREIPIVCDRVLVMYGGRIVAEQDAAAATEESLLTAAHGLEEARS
ncbi:arabinose import ATP-binding protein AraG [bacterium BMS3Bbin01]|nr:arabinose import ATP-binding protein AraG [bacterium BMS3Bbin01]